MTAGISAGSSIFGGLMGSKGAKNAAKAADEKSNQAITVQNNVRDSNVASDLDARLAATEALYNAKGEGQQMVSAATQAGQNNVADTTGTGQANVGAGVTSAQAILDSAQAGQLARLSPYTAAGNTSLNSLQQLAGPGGPLTNKFSFNPSDLQNDPGYQFTLQQGQDALQRSAAAKGQLFSGGTLKSLAGYTTGTANQYFNDAFNRSKSTFDTNQQQALSRINTLQGLAGLGYNASALGSNVIGATGSQEANNTIGGEQFKANLGQQGSQFGATLGETGAQYNANLGAQVGSGLAANDWTTANAITAANTNAGNNSSNLLVGQGLANANAVAGSTNSWLSALNNGTNATLQYLAGRSASASTSN